MCGILIRTLFTCENITKFPPLIWINCITPSKKRNCKTFFFIISPFQKSESVIITRAFQFCRQVQEDSCSSCAPDPRQRQRRQGLVCTYWDCGDARRAKPFKYQLKISIILFCIKNLYIRGFQDFYIISFVVFFSRSWFSVFWLSPS